MVIALFQSLYSPVAIGKHLKVDNPALRQNVSALIVKVGRDACHSLLES